MERMGGGAGADKYKKSFSEGGWKFFLAQIYQKLPPPLRKSFISDLGGGIYPILGFSILGPYYTMPI